MKRNLNNKIEMLANFFYRALLLKLTPAKMKQEVLDEIQIASEETEIIEDANQIIDHYQEFKTILVGMLATNWKWERIPALIQALLIIGVYAIKMTDASKALVINEIVVLTKTLEPDFEFGFVNAILDKINKI
ncbi:transcription antitermination factor NusB [Williamsoniiplasma lucivorax]|uniref:Transcription antitermination protein NusB n=1 Tax=Williamsoniiplasma lucivorax TaxID=209274 RepID=A0A2S5RD67_9MOLU|nr:transcription antitermination factor NusB [Williamsoniiplasma lucivorax]PPE05152.1 transcription antitermination protein NusB [Williamsoniiplasma lucivorax]